MEGVSPETKRDMIDSNNSGAPSTLQDSDTEKATPPKPPGSDAPDGGLQAWLVVVGAWCVSFCSFGWLNSIGVFQQYYQTELLRGHSSSTIAWIPSLQIFFMMGMGPVVGSLYDHFGPRWLILGGSILHVFGIMMASISKEYYQILLSQGVCSAIGVAAISQPAFNCLHGWFNKKRGAAFGIISTGSSIGGVIFPIMITRLMRQVGFGWSMRISAFLLLALLIIANLTIRAYHPPMPQKVTAAQLRKPFTESAFLYLLVGFFLFTFGNFIPINFLPVQAIAAGMDPDLVQYLLPILNAASLFGRLASGFYSDKVGRFNVFVVVCFMSGFWILALWLVDTSQPAIIAFAALFGFFSGAYVSLIAPLIMQVSPMPEIGFRTGIVFFVASIAGLVTNPMNGAILDGSGGWTGLKVAAGVFCLAGTASVAIGRGHATKWKLMVKY